MTKWKKLQRYIYLITVSRRNKCFDQMCYSSLRHLVIPPSSKVLPF